MRHGLESTSGGRFCTGRLWIRPGLPARRVVERSTWDDGQLPPGARIPVDISVLESRVAESPKATDFGRVAPCYSIGLGLHLRVGALVLVHRAKLYVAPCVQVEPARTR